MTAGGQSVFHSAFPSSIYSSWCLTLYHGDGSRTGGNHKVTAIVYSCPSRPSSSRSCFLQAYFYLVSQRRINQPGKQISFDAQCYFCFSMSTDEGEGGRGRWRRTTLLLLLAIIGSQHCTSLSVGVQRFLNVNWYIPSQWVICCSFVLYEYLVQLHKHCTRFCATSSGCMHVCLPLL